MFIQSLLGGVLSYRLFSHQNYVIMRLQFAIKTQLTQRYAAFDIDSTLFFEKVKKYWNV